MIDKEETNIGAHALLVTAEEKIILQQRDDNPEIVNPGLISMFGGTVKKKASIKETLKRELLEELGFNIDENSLEILGVFYKAKEIDGVDWEVNVFVVRKVSLEGLVLNEGKDFICDYPTQLLKRDKLTRITRLALERYVTKNKPWS